MFRHLILNWQCMNRVIGPLACSTTEQPLFCSLVFRLRVMENAPSSFIWILPGHARGWTSLVHASSILALVSRFRVVSSNVDSQDFPRIVRTWGFYSHKTARSEWIEIFLWILLKPVLAGVLNGMVSVVKWGRSLTTVFLWWVLPEALEKSTRRP